MACCCRGNKCQRVSAPCLGRCDLPKHRCLDKEEVKPGPIPKNMGWLYTARTSPEHQLRCGWRPGHISCSALRKMALASCNRCGKCNTCMSSCADPCFKVCCGVPCPGKSHSESYSKHGKRGSATASSAGCDIPCIRPACGTPCPMGSLLRVIRHNGQYTLITEPPDVGNHPSGQSPLKYVINCDPNDSDEKVKFSLEGKYNDYQFDYVSSQASFVLDFSPPDRCPKQPPCKLPCSPCRPC